jgi:hypothetical protein
MIIFSNEDSVKSFPEFDELHKNASTVFHTVVHIESRYFFLNIFLPYSVKYLKNLAI